jgi:hypothetical protein
MVAPPMMPPGAPPGLPPMGGPPPGMPMPPPEVDPTQMLPPDPAIQVLQMLNAVVETEGEQAASEKLLTLPPAVMDALWQLAANAPDLADLLDRLMPTTPEPVQYPRNFIVPPKPDAATILMLAGQDEQFYQDYREEVRVNLGIYNAPATGEAKGVFRNFDPAKEEAFISGSLTHEVNTIKNQIAAARLTFQIPYADPALENDTQKVEDALYAWEAEEARRYQVAGNNPIRHDEAFYLLVCGMVAWRTGLKPDDPDHPFDDALLSPLTVFPVWDERGLCRVTRKYSDTVAAVLSCYGDADGKARKRIMQATNGNVLKSTGEKRFYSIDDRVLCTTYTDRWWYAVYLDGIEVIPPTPHRYGYVPYVIAKSAIGEPMALEDVHYKGMTTAGTSMGQQLRMKYKFVSHFQFRKKSWEYESAYGTKLYNMMSIVDKPDFWIEQDEYASASGTPSVKTGGGGNNMNPTQMNHEKPVPIMASPNAALILQPMAAMFGLERQTGALPLAAMGVFESANESGNAMEGASEAGGDKRQVHLDVLEAFHAAKQELRLKLWRDWGHQVETGEDSYGELTVPKPKDRRRFGGPNAVTITPEMIKRTGTRVESSLRHIRLQNLAPLGNAASVWMSNNAMSAREAMELRGVSDPDAVFLEREYEQALLDPDLQKVRRLMILRKRDPEAAALYERLSAQKSQPQGPPGMGGPPEMGGQMDPNTSAMNLQALGMGQQGATGRPMGSGPPPPPPGSMAIPPQGGAPFGP